MATPNPTWYDILGVARDASPDEIKAAWRAATDKFEPGQGSSQFRLFNEAADVLLDPDRRSAYDAELAGDEPPAAEPDSEPAAEPDDEPDDQPEAEPAVQLTKDAGDVAVVAEPDEPADAEPAEPAAPAAGPLAWLGRLPVVAIAGLGVLAVASLVLAVVLAVQIQHRVDTAEAGPDASASAERALKQVLSYDYRHMEADRDRAARFLTPAYRKTYLKNYNDLLIAGPDGGPGPAVKTQAVVTADVLDTGVVDAERNRVRVVAFVNQSSVKGSGSPTILQNRLVVTMVHSGDDWLIDKITSY
jgi:Mce-associated membrane protein